MAPDPSTRLRQAQPDIAQDDKAPQKDCSEKRGAAPKRVTLPKSANDRSMSGD